MGKTDIPSTLANLTLPENLKRYLINIENIHENSSKEYRLTLMTPHLLESEINQTSGQGPILSIPNDRELNCSNLI